MTTRSIVRRGSTHHAYRGAGSAPVRIKVKAQFLPGSSSGGRSFGKSKKQKARQSRMSIAGNAALTLAMGGTAAEVQDLIAVPEDGEEEEYDGAAEAAAGGWIRHEDEEGNPYWYNEETYDTSWTDPALGDAAAGGALLPGWIEQESEDGSGTYYYHETSGDTSWERPSAAADGSSEGAAGAAGLPAGWSAVVTDDGETYYYNETTEETSWDVPVAELAGHHGAELPPGWEEVVGEDGSTYYHHVESGETAWDHPGGAAAPAAAAAPPSTSSSTSSPSSSPRTGRRSRAASIAHARRGSIMLTSALGKDALATFQVAASGLPAGWEEVIDPESGEPYWVCTATGLSTWERPVAMAIDEVVTGGIDTNPVMEGEEEFEFVEEVDEEFEEDDEMRALNAELADADSSVQRQVSGLKGLLNQGSLSQAEFVEATKLALRRAARSSGNPPLPPPPSHAPPPRGGDGGVEMVAVVIPAGVKPGQMVEFTLADGRRQRMTVPPNSRPGQTIQVRACCMQSIRFFFFFFYKIYQNMLYVCMLTRPSVPSLVSILLIRALPLRSSLSLCVRILSTLYTLLSSLFLFPSPPPPPPSIPPDRGGEGKRGGAEESGPRDARV
jgi:hypothetical protein